MKYSELLTELSRAAPEGPRGPQGLRAHGYNRTPSVNHIYISFVYLLIIVT